MSVRYVSYCRVSGDEQASSGTSLDWQRDQLRAWGDRAGWSHVEDIYDGGESGAKLDRAGILRTIELLRDGDVDLVAFFKVDRAARAQRVFEDLWTTIYGLGGKVFVHQKAKLYETLDDLMDDTVWDRAMAEKERYSIMGRTNDGIAQHLQRGSYIFRTFYGYYAAKERQDGYVANVVHVEDREAAVVRKIFDGVVAGTSYGGITAELNEAGHQTRMRKPWTHMSVQNVIQHRDVYAGRPFERHRTVRGERLSATYSFPPIISADELAAVETALKVRPKGGRPVAPMRGAVRCARCGKVATANRVTSTKNPLSQYVLSCSSRARDFRRARTGLERDDDVCKHSVSVRVVADRLLEWLEAGGYEEALKVLGARVTAYEVVTVAEQRHVTRLEGELQDLEQRLLMVAHEDLVRVSKALETQIAKVTKEIEESRGKVKAAEKRWRYTSERIKTVPTDWKPLAEAIREFDRPAMNRLIQELGLSVALDFGEPDQAKRWSSMRVSVDVPVR
jgi:DNA invertase Pin-like site-specific DNA recombinase